MLTNGVPATNKGKAVEIHHHLFDALWNVGTRQIDASLLLASQSAVAEEGKTLQGHPAESQRAETSTFDENAPA